MAAPGGAVAAPGGAPVVAPLRSIVIEEECEEIVAETGLTGFEAPTWAGIATPRGLPEPVALRLHAVFATAIAEATLRRRLDELTDGEVDAGRPGDMRPFVANEITRWRTVIQQQNIRMEG